MLKAGMLEGVELIDNAVNCRMRQIVAPRRGINGELTTPSESAAYCRRENHASVVGLIIRDWQLDREHVSFLPVTRVQRPL